MAWYVILVVVIVKNSTFMKQLCCTCIAVGNVASAYIKRTQLELRLAYQAVCPKIMEDENNERLT
jgi:hypothetical protein